MDWSAFATVVGTLLVAYIGYRGVNRTSQSTERAAQTNARIEERRIDNEESEQKQETLKDIIAAQRELLTTQRVALTETIADLSKKVTELSTKVDEIERKWQRDKVLLSIAIRFIREVMHRFEPDSEVRIPQEILDEINNH